jgi:hypothetical protein
VKLTTDQIDMLYRCALAEYFTSPTIRSTLSPAHRAHVISELRTMGLVHNPRGDAMWRLTAVGRTALALNLDDERAAVLKNLRTRRENGGPS